MDLDTMGPGMDNDAYRGMASTVGKGHGSKLHSVKEIHAAARHHRSARHEAPHPKSKSHAPKRHAADHEQEATSLPGFMPIIRDVQRAGRGAVGIPGIISSTTLGPEQRHRLVAGIIETTTGRSDESGPVRRVQGMDATAYNEGMVHIAGSHFK
jgi:hypothetical protein